MDSERNPARSKAVSEILRNCRSAVSISVGCAADTSADLGVGASKTAPDRIAF